MASIEQSDFGAGVYRGRKAPTGSVYDAVNALVDDEGQMFERGKSALLSTSNTTNNLLGVAAVSVAAGDRVLAWDSGKTYVLDGSNAPTNLQNPVGPADFVTYPMARIPVTQGCAVIPQATDTTGVVMLLWAGSLKNLPNTSVTVDLVHGSRDVSGAGTPAWLTTIDRGVFLASDAVGIVDQVVSNTALKLRDPWAGATATTLVTFASALVPVAAVSSQETWNGLVQTIAGRIVFALGNRIYFTSPDPLSDYVTLTTFIFPAADYHELSTGSQVSGLGTYADTLVPFATTGTWAIQNMSLDPVDDAGNVQQIVGRLSDPILWNDSGVAEWSEMLVVPAVDDVYLLAQSGEVRVLSEGIRPLYRSYAKAGYRLGTATVHRGHYLLPIVNGTTFVDELVCRLDRPYQTPSGRVFYPWTRWSGHAAAIAYANSIGASSRSPKLLGVGAKRVTDLSACMDVTGAATQDADSTTPTFTVDLNDSDLGAGPFPSQAGMARTVYETTGGTPTPTMASAIGPEGASYTAATLIKGGGASDGTDYSAWRVNRRAERIRLRFQNTSQVTSLILRSVSLWVRQSGRS